MTQERSQPPDAISRTGWAVAQMPEDERAPWRFALCWMLECRYSTGRDPGDLKAAVAEFERLPEATPGRRKLAAVLLVDLVKTGRLRDEPAVAQAMALADVVRADPAPLAGSREACAVVRALDLQLAGMNGRAGFSPQAALAELDRLETEVGGMEPHSSMIASARLAMRHLLSTVAGDHSLADQMSDDLAEFRKRLPPDSPAVGHLDLMDLLMAGYAQAMRGDLAGARKAYDAILDAMRQLPENDPRRAQLAHMQATMAPLFRQTQDGGVADPRLRGTGSTPYDATVAAELAQLRALADVPGLDPAERALRMGTSGAAKMGVGADHPPVLDQAIIELAEAVAISPEHDPRRPFYRLQLGVARMLRFESRKRITDLQDGTAELERARTALGTTAHAMWTMTSMPLAHAYRLSGRKALSRDTALSGLRGHAWSVLLQSDAPAAAAAARHASDDAIDVARWCVSDGRPDLAARALDMGRGLMLHAATERRAIPERLIELGEPGLAEQWRTAVALSGVEEAPAQLRHRVMSVLAGIPVDDDGAALDSPATGSARLLDAPDGPEIHAALRMLGFDALVYLVPGDGKNGMAVIVPAEDQASTLLLPELNDVPAGFLADAARELPDDPRLGPDRDLSVRGRAKLEDVCDWAWRVAIGPLLERGLRAHRAPAGGPPRVVLIPMRELSAVPWHAARRQVNGRYRYAVEQAVFSYAPSARLMCDAAWASDVPLDDSALVLGDPDAGGAADLPAARAEALAIHGAFYRQGVYLGRTATGAPAAAGAGTRREVLDRLLDGTAGSVLHLACHGVTRRAEYEQVGAAGESSYLALAGGDRLSAEELVGALTARPERPVGLSVLAACNSGVPGRGHDEAFSVATALLAGGSRTVVSTLWSVPDTPTSALMYMFHHYVRREGCRPLDALHRAQVWMLTPDRRIPEEMPEPLRPASGREQSIDGWAGFFHTGR
ncbi:hypothetical protein CS0771_03420 [Catellatospora sp. IY07-71]|uniref:CHAT domain-containing protein n=1 Tax=Catellatospora sp. IY07-71 TaxID=2728827 RepID=UPI001BB37C5C|nr:CHAT domain-containing protein [Catellatospora sp. IY07-71]BCJ70798.1 hypothetical protein CS0771_03420 [Catellatospora sp. IY07-71]